jgi:hypothetical protein
MVSTLERQPQANPLDELLAAEGNFWTNLDSSYDRGLRAGKSEALREHLGLIVEAASMAVAKRPQDRETILAFVSHLQRVLVDPSEADNSPFEFDGGLGI